MKIIKSAIFRALCAVVIGVVLVVYPEQATSWLIIAIGTLFMVPGIIMLMLYFLHKPTDGERGLFPIGGLGSLLLGALLVAIPSFFVAWLMFVLGGILVFAGAVQVVQLLKRSKHSTVAIGFYFLPVLLVLAGVLTFFNLLRSATIAFIILGVCHILYGISEVVHSITFREGGERKTHKPEETVQEPPSVE